MDCPLTDKKNILWLKLICFSFYMISDLAGDKDDNFVKVVIVPFKLPVGAVVDMKKPEVFFEIAGLGKGILRIIPKISSGVQLVCVL